MLLHKEKEFFREVIETAAVELKMPVSIVEKDYYVTMILRKLAEKAPKCVFKGGTSLSKCHHAINRFSEDIDISFSDTLTQGQRKKLKNNVIAEISEELELPISDWEKTRSRRDYNCYTFSYEPLEGYVPKSLVQGVKMEVSLGPLSFPTVQLPVDSYVYQFLSKENETLIAEYELEPFVMALQSLERTFADKVFALCDYYMSGRIKRNSRHIYDIYMLYPQLDKRESLKELIHEVRLHRAGMDICPSAKRGIDIEEMLQKIIDERVYHDDYQNITIHFQTKQIPYNEAIKVLYEVLKSGLFRDEQFMIL